MGKSVQQNPECATDGCFRPADKFTVNNSAHCHMHHAERIQGEIRSVARMFSLDLFTSSQIKGFAERANWQVRLSESTKPELSASVQSCDYDGCPYPSGQGNRKRCNGHHVLDRALEILSARNSTASWEPGTWIHTLVGAADCLLQAASEFSEDMYVRGLALDRLDRSRTQPPIPEFPGVSSELHVLYRFFDADGELLYVGITCNPGARMKSHSKEKEWWHMVRSSTMEHFSSRQELMVAELSAIRSEHPRYNIAGKVPA